jgi:ABC-type branched-subunit amino acid transport system ATPase component
MSLPSLLLMDEPSMGLSPILVEEIFRIIQEINSQGTSILLVEQMLSASAANCSMCWRPGASCCLATPR